MGKPQFQPEDITKGLKLLVNKFTRSGYLMDMIDRRYQPSGFLISHRTTGFSMVLSEVAFHIYGQLGRYCFDKSHRDYLTASISEIYEQIEISATQSAPKGVAHIEEFKKAKTSLATLNADFFGKFTIFSNKYYAHLEIRAIDESEPPTDHENIQASWNDLKDIYSKSKSILSIMWLYWDDSECNFEEGSYSRITRDFWGLIDIPEDASDPSDWRWHRKST